MNQNKQTARKIYLSCRDDRQMAYRKAVMRRFAVTAFVDAVVDAELFLCVVEQDGIERRQSEELKIAINHGIEHEMVDSRELLRQIRTEKL